MGIWEVHAVWGIEYVLIQSNPKWNRWQSKQVSICFIFQILWFTDYPYLFWEPQNICKNQMKDSRGDWERQVKCGILQFSFCQIKKEQFLSFAELEEYHRILGSSIWNEIFGWGNQKGRKFLTCMKSKMKQVGTRVRKTEMDNIQQKWKWFMPTLMAMHPSRAKSLVSKYRSAHKETRVSWRNGWGRGTH